MKLKTILITHREVMALILAGRTAPRDGIVIAVETASEQLAREKREKRERAQRRRVRPRS